MKIRMDFVTNSSSSCYVTMVIETKDGKNYSGAFVGDAVQVPSSCIVFNDSLSLRKVLTGTSVRDLLDVLDEAYSGLFSHYQELSMFFDDDAKHIKADMLRWNGVSAPLGGQQFMEAMPLSEIKSVEIQERFDADESNGSGFLKLDLINKAEHFSSFLDNFEHEEKRDLISGVTTVLKDEECESDDDWDDDDEDFDEDDED